MKAASINHLIAKSANTVKFKVGAKFVATVKAVHESGIYIVMPNDKGSGLISPRCFGEGIRRREALAAIHPDDKIPVAVKEFYPQTTTILLVPDTDSKSYKGAGCNEPRPQHGRCDIQRKRDYELVAPSTTFLVDCANLLGDIGPEDAASRLRTIRDSLVSFGHRAAFFLEHRAFTWLKYNQESEAKAEAFTRFVDEAGVSLVQGEADLAILQCARQVPGSACLSNDGFVDYGKVFGDIVGTSRVRRFSWAKIGDSLFLSIEGLADAIVVKPEGMTNSLPETSCVSDGVVEAEIPTMAEVADEPEAPVTAEDGQPLDRITDSSASHRRPDAPSGDRGILALGATMLAGGAEKKAIACFAKAAKTNPFAWAELAWMYHDGNCVKADKAKARRFFRKAREMAAKERQCKIRRARARLRKNRLFGLVTLRGCAA